MFDSAGTGLVALEGNQGGPLQANATPAAVYPYDHIPTAASAQDRALAEHPRGPRQDAGAPLGRGA